MARERAHALFSQLSGDLAKIASEYPARVLCPLCLTPFTEDAIDLEEPQFTEEHIIPGELGGTAVTLTCKRCNNTHGSQIEAHLIQRVRSHDSLQGAGDRFLKGRIDIGGIIVPADIEWRVATSETTVFRLRQFDPAVYEAIRKQLRDGSVETVKVKTNLDYIPLRSWLALFRVAYLAMFRAAGYRYILSPAAGVVREIICRFEDAPEQLGRIVTEVKDVSPAPTEPLQIFLVGGGSPQWC